MYQPAGIFQLLLISFLFHHCAQAPAEWRQADLQPLATASGLTVQEQRGLKAGGIAEVDREAVIREGMEVHYTDDCLRMRILEAAAHLEFVPVLLDLPADWKSFARLRLRLENPEADSIKAIVRLIGVRGVLSDSLTLSGGKTGELSFELFELPLLSSGTDMYRPLSLRLEVKPRRAPAVLELAELALLLADWDTPPPVADRFGQRIRGSRPDKITDKTELRAAAQREREALAGQKLFPGRDTYGGRLEGPRFEATGFFRLERGPTRNGLTHWWLVTPEGHPFWSLGVTGVRYNFGSEVTSYRGREYIFEALPLQTDKYREAYTGEGVSFYAWNILRKWDSLPAWRNIISHRLAGWGLNTLGSWSEETVLDTTFMPHTRFLRSNNDTTLRLGDSRIIDAFDSRWTEHLDTAFAKISSYKDDPRLLGYFVDNEQPWQRLNLLENAPSGGALRQWWGEYLRQKYKTVARLNRTWRSNLPSWKTARALTGPPAGASETFAVDVIALEREYAERYFRTIAAALKKHDPNHLYLGCRFTKRVKPDHIVAAAGKYCDIISVNNYSLYPTRERMERWHRLSGGRPILIGEHHLPLRSERQVAPRWRNFTEEERYRYYLLYVRSWAQMPFAVGSHWYQLVDQPITGRGMDGENQTVGLLDITDRPHRELVRAIGEASRQMYEWHAEGEEGR